MNNNNMTMMFGLGLGTNVGVKTLDVMDFYKHNYKTEGGAFGIPVWYMGNASKHVECRVINIPELYEADHEAFQSIVGTAMDLGIKPLMEEVMRLEVIPRYWMDYVKRLGDFYRNFHVSGVSIDKILLHFDKHLEESEEKSILRLFSGDDSRSNIIFKEVDLYKQARDNVDLDKLKKLEMQYTVFLSELEETDANAIIRKLKDTEIRCLVYDFKNLESTPSPEEAAELVKVASRYGISIDFGKESESYEVKVYPKVYRMLYNFTNEETLSKSLEESLNKFGSDFYFTLNFRRWYPVTLSKTEDGWVITSRESKRGIGLDLKTYDTGRLRGLNKLTSNSYLLDLRLWTPVGSPFGLINSLYVGSDDFSEPMPKEIMERGNWIGQ